VTPLAPQRFGFQVTLDQETHDLLRRAQALMSHQVRAGEILPVLNGALRCFVAQLEKRKYAATRCPRPSKPGSSSRHIPAAVKRAVRERDGDRCAFVSESGQRCSERTRLEFDHIEPVSRGGNSTVENLRLLCRAHNQYAAEREFGAEFMEQKRAEAQHAPAGR
jgi:5-methylcytosine-specific restriction endonuclease McrA